MAPVATGSGASPADPRFFASAAELRGWLQEHHATHTELWVGLHRKSSGVPSITWPELVDELLCFGWIDGVRKSVDETRYANRVTPRRRGSNWSAVNLKRVEELTAQGRMAPAGRAAFDARDETRTQRYSFEREQVSLGAYEQEFRRHRRAWAFFAAQPPGYRKTASWWVMSAKREDTRRRRFETLMRDSADRRRIALLRRREEEA